MAKRGTSKSYNQVKAALGGPKAALLRRVDNTSASFKSFYRATGSHQGKRA